MVNRIWHHIFGTGIVATTGDFGSAGAMPSHPELLDWLSAEFMNPSEHTKAKDWSIHHMIRMMVMSKAFRQASTPILRDLAKMPMLDSCGVFLLNGWKQRSFVIPSCSPQEIWINRSEEEATEFTTKRRHTRSGRLSTIMVLIPGDVCFIRNVCGEWMTNLYRF